MPRHDPPDGSPRRIGQPALVCFAVSGIALAACALGLFVNHFLTGALAISGTAAIGLIYLALGLMNLGHDADTVRVRIREPHQTAQDEKAAAATSAEPAPYSTFSGEPDATVPLAPTSRETALSGSDPRG